MKLNATGNDRIAFFKACIPGFEANGYEKPFHYKLRGQTHLVVMEHWITFVDGMKKPQADPHVLFLKEGERYIRGHAKYTENTVSRKMNYHDFMCFIRGKFVKEEEISQILSKLLNV